MATELEIFEEINRFYADVDFSLTISFKSPSEMMGSMDGKGTFKLKVSGATGNINGTILSLKFKPYTGFVYKSLGGLISSPDSINIENIELLYSDVDIAPILMKDIENKPDYKKVLNELLRVRLQDSIKNLINKQKFTDAKYPSKSFEGAIFDIKDLNIL